MTTVTITIIDTTGHAPAAPARAMTVATGSHKILHTEGGLLLAFFV